MSSNPVQGNVPHPTSYAQAASAPSNNVQPQPFKQLSQQPYDRSHESNVILFGVPEGRSIIDSKAVVDEIFEFLTGRPIAINDIFRLGKRSQSSHPRPLLVKLSALWDPKVLLSQKKNLKNFRIRRLFLREDVPPESKLRQKGLKQVSHVQEQHTNGQEVHDDVATESSVHVPGDDLLAFSQPNHSSPPHTDTHRPESIPSYFRNSPTHSSSITPTTDTSVQIEANS